LLSALPAFGKAPIITITTTTPSSEVLKLGLFP